MHVCKALKNIDKAAYLLRGIRGFKLGAPFKWITHLWKIYQTDTSRA